MESRSSTALIEVWSINSSIDGRNVAVMSTTASAAASKVGNDATNVLAGGRAGSRRSSTSVITPSVPSLPTKSFISDSPATSLIRGPPIRTTVPSARTTSSPST